MHFSRASPRFGAADDSRLALASRAQTDFDRAETSATPSLADSEQCVQSEAALLAVAPPEEAPLAHYRKGYCTLAGALITRDAGEFAQAGREFDQSLESWAARPRVAGKNALPEAPSAGLRVLASIARLKAGPDQSGIDRERVALAQALVDPNCPAGVMPVNLCRDVLEDGRRWLGWIAFERDNLPEAARDFSGPGAEGWSAWVAGRSAASRNQYPEAASEYRIALDSWTARSSQAPSLAARLMPEPDLAPDYEDLGGAQILAGDAVAALASLDEAVKLNPSNAHAIYLRGRAKEMAGRSEEALADYSLASRTAFANAKIWLRAKRTSTAVSCFTGARTTRGPKTEFPAPLISISRRRCGPTPRPGAIWRPLRAARADRAPISIAP